METRGRWGNFPSQDQESFSRIAAGPEFSCEAGIIDVCISVGFGMGRFVCFMPFADVR